MLSFYLLMVDTDEERAKFRYIYEKYKGLVYTIASKIINEHDTAVDATQNTFLSIALHISTIKTDNERMLKAYVCRIAENSAIDLYRRMKRQNQLQTVTCLDVPDDCDVYNEIEGRECVKRLLVLINQLPKSCRDTLILNLLHKRSVKDIAQILNINCATARKRLFRAKIKLKELLKEVTKC